jgi:hypothetical protein
MLMSHPASGHTIAKLGNFSSATLDIRDRSLLAVDVRALIVFVYNLFITKFSDCVHFPVHEQDTHREGALPAALFQFSGEFVEAFPDLVLLVMNGWDKSTIEAKEVADTLAQVRRDELARSSSALVPARPLQEAPQRSAGRATQHPAQHAPQPAPQILGLPAAQAALQSLPQSSQCGVHYSL